jgi:hypothetical protein
VIIGLITIITGAIMYKAGSHYGGYTILAGAIMIFGIPAVLIAITWVIALMEGIWWLTATLIKPKKTGNDCAPEWKLREQQVYGSRIKTVLSLLLLICLMRMSGDYYMFVRLACLIGFGVLAYYAYCSQNRTGLVFYIGLVILFQPLIKISFERATWHKIDVALAVILISSILAPWLRRKLEGLAL